MSNGYTESNAAILDLNDGEIEHKANLSSTKRAQLLSSVFKTQSHLWWTSYREEKIYRTDLELNKFIISVNEAKVEEGGEGAILIKLKNL